MTLARLLLVVALWLGAAVLAALTRQVDTGLREATALRQALLAAPAAALYEECAREPPAAQTAQAAAPPAPTAPFLAVCDRTLLWHSAAGWSDACLQMPPPVPLPPRRYEIRLACSWRLGPLTGALPLLRATLFR